MSGRTLDDVCELLEEVVNQLSKVSGEVSRIEAAVNEEHEINEKRWKDLMKTVGDIKSSVVPMRETVDGIDDQLSDVYGEVKFIREALQKKEMDIDSKRWKDLMEKLGGIDSSVRPMQCAVVDGFDHMHNKLSKVYGKVKLIKTALETDETGIDSAQWNDLMRTVGDIKSSVAPMQSTVVDGFAVMHDKLVDLEKAIKPANPESE